MTAELNFKYTIHISFTGSKMSIAIEDMPDDVGARLSVADDLEMVAKLIRQEQERQKH